MNQLQNVGLSGAGTSLRQRKTYPPAGDMATKGDVEELWKGMRSLQKQNEVLLKETRHRKLEMKKMKDRLDLSEKKNKELKEEIDAPKKQKLKDKKTIKKLNALAQENKGKLKGYEERVKQVMTERDKYKSQYEHYKKRYEDATKVQPKTKGARYEKKVKEVTTERDQYKRKNEDYKRRYEVVTKVQPKTKNWWRVIGLVLLGGLAGAGIGAGVAVGMAYIAGQAVVSTAAGAGFGAVAGACAGGIYGYKTS